MLIDLTFYSEQRTYLEDLEGDIMFKNPLSVELMADSFDLLDHQSFLDSKEIARHDYYDYIKEEQNRNWAIQMYFFFSMNHK